MDMGERQTPWDLTREFLVRNGVKIEYAKPKGVESFNTLKCDGSGRTVIVYRQLQNPDRTFSVTFEGKIEEGRELVAATFRLEAWSEADLQQLLLRDANRFYGSKGCLNLREVDKVKLETGGLLVYSLGTEERFPNVRLVRWGLVTGSISGQINANVFQRPRRVPVRPFKS